MSKIDLPRLAGVVGLSPLGAAIARRLAASGIRVAAYDADPAARVRLSYASRLIEIAPGLADVGQDCEVVISTLDGGALAATVLGDQDRPGLGHLLVPGSLVIDMGASSPHDARRLAVMLGSRGVALADAPALGTPDDGEAGTLTIPLGGFPDFVARATPLLGLLGSVTPTGQIGSGHTLAALLAAKLVAQSRMAAELVALASAAGIALPSSLLANGGPAGAGWKSGHEDARKAVETPTDPATAIRLAVARGLAALHAIDARTLLGSVPSNEPAPS